MANRPNRARSRTNQSDGEDETLVAWLEAEQDTGFRERLLQASEGMARGEVTRYSEIRDRRQSRPRP